MVVRIQNALPLQLRVRAPPMGRRLLPLRLGGRVLRCRGKEIAQIEHRRVADEFRLHVRCRLECRDHDARVFRRGLGGWCCGLPCRLFRTVTREHGEQQQCDRQ